MGLFGRDDRATETTTPAAATPSRPAATGGAGTTVVARSTRFEGTLSGSGDIHVDGELLGEIAVTGGVTVAEAGSVRAGVNARVVVVAGTVDGDMSATEKIELAESAKVRGNITAPRILIRDGANFEGQVFMKQPDRKAGPTGSDAGGSNDGRSGGSGGSKSADESGAADAAGTSGQRPDGKGTSEQGKGARGRDPRRTGNG